MHHILITHDHADHVKSVGSLSTDYHLPVYATRKVHAGIERNYCVRKKIVPNHAHIIEKGVPFVVGEFRVTPFGVPHDSTDNVGYFVEHEGVTFCLITDVGHITEEIQEFIGKASYFEQQVSLAAFTDATPTTLDDIPVTWASTPARELGTTLADRMMQKITHEETHSRNLIIPARLIAAK